MADVAQVANTWKFEDARARLTEVVRRAKEQGPQHVTVRGKEAVVVVSAEEFERLRGPRRTGADLMATLQGMEIWKLVPERDKDTGRDIEFPLVIRWLLDTNVVIEMLKPDRDPSVAAWVASEEEASLSVSVLTIAEFAQGAGKLPDDDSGRLRVEAELAAIEASFAGRILPVDRKVAVRFGYLSSLLRRSGRKPPVIDTLLAATAIHHGLVLVTRNTKDMAATGAQLLDPWVPGGPTARPLPASSP